MDSESEFDVEWQEMPADFVSDITEEEVEHIVEYLLAADVYLDDVDLTDDVQITRHHYAFLRSILLHWWTHRSV